MALTRPQIRSKLYDLFGPEHLGWASSYTARSTTAITDYTRWGTNTGQFNFEGYYLYLPWATSPHNIKRFGAIASGVMTLADRAWPDTDTGNVYEALRRDVHPSELNACIREAIEELYAPTERPISIWDLPDGTGDGAFDEANTTSWIQGDAGAAPTIEKSALAGYNLTGYKSLKITNGAANNYIVHNVDVPVAPGEQLWLAANAILAQGTNWSFSIWDKDSNSATYNTQIGSTLTAYGLLPQHVGATFTAPGSGATGCHAINLHIGAAAATSILYVDALPGHSLSRTRLAPPDWAKQNWQISGFGPTRYEHQVESGVWTAESRRDFGWKRGPYGDWKTASLTENANPRDLIVLKDRLPAQDMWVRGVRQESETEALLSESGATNADPELVMAVCVVKVRDMLADKGVAIDPAKMRRYEEIASARRSLNVEQEEAPEPKRLVVGRWG